MIDKRELMSMLPVNTCEEGQLSFDGVHSDSEITRLFWRYVDFCFANNFPSNEYLRANAGIASAHNIYIDAKTCFQNLKLGAFLGESICTLNYDSYSVAKLYITHQSKINIRASGNAFVIVDALDVADIVVDVSDEAKVIVTLYAQATCTGATKITHTHLQTYDLQT